MSTSDAGNPAGTCKAVNGVHWLQGTACGSNGAMECTQPITRQALNLADVKPSRAGALTHLHSCDAEILGACLLGCSARCASMAAASILSIGGCRVHQEIHPLDLPCRIGCGRWASQHGCGSSKFGCTYHLHRGQDDQKMHLEATCATPVNLATAPPAHACPERDTGPGCRR